MKRLGVLVFGAAFVTSLLAGGPGCVYDTQCDCRPPRPQPEAQGPLTGLTVSSYDAQGQGVTSFVQPENGSLEVKPTEVVFAYEQEGVTHRVIYAVVPTP
jgi:hypothetical protein